MISYLVDPDLVTGYIVGKPLIVRRYEVTIIVPASYGVMRPAFIMVQSFKWVIRNVFTSVIFCFAHPQHPHPGTHTL